MDPTREICRRRLLSLSLSPSVDVYNGRTTNLTNNLSIITGDIGNLPPVYCDIKDYEKLILMKEKYNNSKFHEAKLLCNPFEKIGRSIFIDRASIKLANIDAIFNLTRHDGGLMKMQSPGDFSFADVAGGPGGFTQYLQWRRYNGKGFGITLREGTADWSTNVIDMNRFVISYGRDNTGDITDNNNIIAFEKTVKMYRKDGLDLVVADGGFSTEGKEEKQEFLTHRLLLCQVIIGLKTVKVGGNFVVKCFDTVTSLSGELIFILSTLFESICVFKPISSRPANSERYIVCKNYRGVNEQINNFLLSANNSYTDKKVITSYFGGRDKVGVIPDDFIAYLTKVNNDSINLQIITGECIIAAMEGKRTISSEEFNLLRCLTVWNLPSSRPRTKENRDSKE